MKTVLITGANSEIGAAVALALAGVGRNLALHYFSNRQGAEVLDQRVRAAGAQSQLLRCDLTEPSQAKRMIDEVLARFSAIDVLINTVGPFVYKSLLEVTPDEWHTDIDLNLHTCFHTTYYALDALRRSRGQIINFAFSGVETGKGWPMSAGYGAAKCGVAALTKSLAIALAPEKVCVNAILPGLVAEGAITEPEFLEMAAQIPYGRPVRPEEVAKTVAWLVTESPETLTGAFISVSGAWAY